MSFNVLDILVVKFIFKVWCFLYFYVKESPDVFRLKTPSNKNQKQDTKKSPG